LLGVWVVEVEAARNTRSWKCGRNELLWEPEFGRPVWVLALAVATNTTIGTTLAPMLAEFTFSGRLFNVKKGAIAPVTAFAIEAEVVANRSPDGLVLPR